MLRLHPIEVGFVLMGHIREITPKKYGASRKYSQCPTFPTFHVMDLFIYFIFLTSQFYTQGPIPQSENHVVVFFLDFCQCIKRIKTTRMYIYIHPHSRQ